MFDMRCQENGIEHRLTKIEHPWTNGQVERMNRTIKEATVQSYHYDRHDQLEAHLADFITAYNYARRLKTLKGLTPYEYIQMLDFPARTIQTQSAPANAGTKHVYHLGFSWRWSRVQSPDQTRSTHLSFGGKRGRHPWNFGPASE
jgi:hypothetical protein